MWVVNFWKFPFTFQVTTITHYCFQWPKIKRKSCWKYTKIAKWLMTNPHWRTIGGTDISVKLEQGRANYSRVPAISKYILSLNAYVLDITPIIKCVILKTTLNWLISFLYMNIFYINFLEQQNLKFVSLSFAYPMFIWEWEKSTSFASFKM